MLIKILLLLLLITTEANAFPIRVTCTDANFQVTAYRFSHDDAEAYNIKTARDKVDQSLFEGIDSLMTVRAVDGVAELEVDPVYQFDFLGIKITTNEASFDSFCSLRINEHDLFSGTLLKTLQHNGQNIEGLDIPSCPNCFYGAYTMPGRTLFEAIYPYYITKENVVLSPALSSSYSYTFDGVVDGPTTLLFKGADDNLTAIKINITAGQQSTVSYDFINSDGVFYLNGSAQVENVHVVQNNNAVHLAGIEAITGGEHGAYFSFDTNYPARTALRCETNIGTLYFTPQGWSTNVYYFDGIDSFAAFLPYSEITTTGKAFINPDNRLFFGNTLVSPFTTDTSSVGIVQTSSTSANGTIMIKSASENSISISGSYTIKKDDSSASTQHTIYLFIAIQVPNTNEGVYLVPVGNTYESSSSPEPVAIIGTATSGTGPIPVHFTLPLTGFLENTDPYKCYQYGIYKVIAFLALEDGQPFAVDAVDLTIKP